MGKKTGRRNIYGIIIILISACLVIYGLTSFSPAPKHEFVTASSSVSFGTGIFTSNIQEITVVEANAPQYTLPLDISQVKNIEPISRRFNLDGGGLQLLRQNGFVVVSLGQYDQFDEIYNLIDQIGFPIFITADSMLHVYHIFFDEILRSIEEQYFADDLKKMMTDLVEKSIDIYEAIPSEHDLLKEASRRNVCFFCVAAKLLDPDFSIPQFASDLVESELNLIEAHEQMDESPLFNYTEDYTQYIPRGHYTRSEVLERYFRAVMWLGRMRFMAKSTSQPELSRRQTIQAVLIVQVLNSLAEAKAAWEKIYAATSFFVGYSDDLTIYDYDKAMKEVYGTDFEITDLGDTNKLEQLQAKIVELNQAKIVSSPIYPWQKEELIGLRFMGQRFIPDSYIFQELVFDKVEDRFMPKSLDAMAVFGSRRAEEHLASDVETYADYGEQLNKLKIEFSSHNISTWTQNLYWSWLYALNSTLQEPPAGYPTFMTQPAWLDEKLNTALGSWTELRHDTILYAKQSYTVLTAAPEQPPPGYVEPLPSLYSRLQGLCNMTLTGLESLGLLNSSHREGITKFRALLGTLQQISLKELKGEELLDEETQTIKSIGYQLGDILKAFTPEAQRSTLVADVHTDPNSGMVLEEGCGYLDFIIAVYKAPNGQLIATVGPVFSYYEFQHPMSQRLTDEAWITTLKSGATPQRPTWTESFYSP